MRCERCNRDLPLYDFPDDYGVSEICNQCCGEINPAPPPEEPEETRERHLDEEAEAEETLEELARALAN